MVVNWTFKFKGCNQFWQVCLDLCSSPSKLIAAERQQGKPCASLLKHKRNTASPPMTASACCWLSLHYHFSAPGDSAPSCMGHVIPWPHAFRKSHCHTSMLFHPSRDGSQVLDYGSCWCREKGSCAEDAAHALTRVAVSVPRATWMSSHADATLTLLKKTLGLAIVAQA
eukprot:2113851-Amphidinium_carterae.1